MDPAIAFEDGAQYGRLCSRPWPSGPARWTSLFASWHARAAAASPKSVWR